MLEFWGVEIQKYILGIRSWKDTKIKQKGVEEVYAIKKPLNCYCAVF